MKRISLVLTIVALSCVFAFGQDDYKKGEFFVGFSNNQVDTGIESGDIPGDPIEKRQSFNGFNVSGVYNVSRYFGIKGDVSGAYRNDSFDFSVPDGTGGSSSVGFDADSSLYNVLGGVQVKDNSSEARVKPFAHALVGAGIGRVKLDNVSCPTGVDCDFLDGLDERETGLAGAFGGGIDIKLSNRIDLRAVQVDYNPIRFDGGTQHNVRIGIGLVFK
jgi:hypothetical protein